MLNDVDYTKLYKFNLFNYYSNVNFGTYNIGLYILPVFTFELL